MGKFQLDTELLLGLRDAEEGRGGVSVRSTGASPVGCAGTGPLS